mgnify:FL=1
MVEKKNKIIDLSHPLYDGMSTYPSDPDVSIIKEKDILSDRTLLHRFSMGTHTGTHLDAPAHMIRDGKTLDDFPLETFFGRSVKINDKTINDLKNIGIKIDGIIYDSGWYKNYNNSKIFYGSNRPIIPNQLVEQAQKMSIKFFGCDLPSVDSSGSKDKPIHNGLLGMDIILYESLTNLDKLPIMSPFDFYGFPLRFKNLDGSPVRAIAVI